MDTRVPDFSWTRHWASYEQSGQPEHNLAGQQGPIYKWEEQTYQDQTFLCITLHREWRNNVSSTYQLGTWLPTISQNHYIDNSFQNSLDFLWVSKSYEQTSAHAPYGVIHCHEQPVVLRSSCFWQIYFPGVVARNTPVLTGRIYENFRPQNWRKSDEKVKNRELSILDFVEN